MDIKEIELSEVNRKDGYITTSIREAIYLYLQDVKINIFLDTDNLVKFYVSKKDRRLELKLEYFENEHCIVKLNDWFYCEKVVRDAYHDFKRSVRK